MFCFKVTLGVYFVLVYKVTIFLCKQTKKIRFSIKGGSKKSDINLIVALHPT